MTPLLASRVAIDGAIPMRRMEEEQPPMVPLTWQLAAIRGMRGDQILARVRLRARRALGNSRLVRRASARRTGSMPHPGTRPLGLPPPNTQHPTPNTLTALAARAEAVAAGRFRFLNEERAWALPVDWGAPGAARLWRFHLHYFEDAPALALASRLTGEARFVQLFCSLAADWIAHNPIGVGDGWHPYTLSRRIPNWIYAFELAGLSGSAAGAPVAASLHDQTRFLARSLEFDALGNHLLANVRALLFADSFFDGAEAQRWGRTAARILEAEVAEQFLADGGHFERSPMYHALVLQDLLECAALFRHRGEIPGWLSETIRRAEPWLRAMSHPDGDVALFNDSVLDGPPPAELTAFAGALRGAPPQGAAIGWRQWAWFGGAQLPSAPPSGMTAPGDTTATRAAAGESAAALTALPETGYFVVRDPAAGHALFLDAGDPCPSYVPAHAHADLLSYELSLFGRRVIVDSGVLEYAPGRWRDFCRSTRAHNTVQVDGQDQSEVWGSFRLGRRAAPVDVRWQCLDGVTEVSAAHTGYRRLGGGLMHRRVVTYDGAAFRVQDDVTGSGPHRVESFIHFHPEMEVRIEPEGVVAAGQGVRLVIRVPEGIRIELRRGEGSESAPPQGWYCPEFGLRVPNFVAVLATEGALPIRLGYQIVPGEANDPRHNEVSSSG